MRSLASLPCLLALSLLPSLVHSTQAPFSTDSSSSSSSSDSTDPATSQTLYTLLHRLERTSATSPWVPRARIHLSTPQTSLPPGSTNAALVPSATYEAIDEEGVKGALGSESLDAADLYQIMLVPGDEKDWAKNGRRESGPVSFGKTCQALHSISDALIIHLSPPLIPSADPEPRSISYDVVLPRGTKLKSDGCPDETTMLGSSKPLGKATKGTEQGQEDGKTNVIVRTGVLGAKPPPKPAPPTKPDGTPLAEGEEPPKEKSFVAKYWMYIVPIIILLAIPTELADSGDEEGEGGAEPGLLQNAPSAGAAGRAGGGPGAGGGAGMRRVR